MPTSQAAQPSPASTPVQVSPASVVPETVDQNTEASLPALPSLDDVDSKQLQAILDERLVAIDKAIKQVKSTSQPLVGYLKMLDKRLEPAVESGFNQIAKAIVIEKDRVKGLLDQLQISALPDAMTISRPRPESAPMERQQAPVTSAPAQSQAASPAYVRPTPVMEPTVRVLPTVAPPIPRPAHSFTLQDLNDFTNWAVEFRDRAEDLKRDAGNTDPRELRIQVEMLAFEGRIEQDRWAGHPKDGPWEHAYQTSVRGFGALTSIATGFLNPLGISVRGIRRDQRLNWPALMLESKERLAELREKIRTESEAESRRRETEERERTIAMDRERRAAMLRGSITEAIDEVLDNQSEEAQQNLLDLVGQYIDLSTVDHWLADECFRLQGVVDLKELFKGSDFRLLRKKLDRKEEGSEDSGDSGENQAVSVEAEDPEFEDDDEEEVDEDADVIDRRYPGFRGLFQDLRGMMAGGKRKAVAEKGLKDFFGFAEFEWMETSRTAAVDRKLEARVLNRQYDVVVLLARFLSKSTQDALRQACREVGIPCLILSHGYGKGAMVQAIIQWREGQGA